MAIEIKSTVVVGFRFSDVCSLHTDAPKPYYTYLTEALGEKIAKQFEDGVIEQEEINPELISLVLDLGCFEYHDSYQNDAMIGVKIISSDAGNMNFELTDIKDVEKAKTKVLAHIKEIDPEIIEKIKIEIGVVTQMEEVSIK